MDDETLVEIKVAPFTSYDHLTLPAGTQIASYKSTMVVVKPNEHPCIIVFGEHGLELQPLEDVTGL